MPTITVMGRPFTYAAAPAPPAMTIRSAEGGERITVPFAPVPTSHDGFGWDWETVARAGREPLLLRSARVGATLSFKLVLAGRTLQTSVDATLRALLRLIESGDAVTIAYGRPEQGRWRLLSMPYDVTARTQTGNAPSRAEVTMTFAAASDVPRQIGSTSKKPTAKKSTGTAKAPAKKSPVKTYTVRPGDTMSGIARKVYGDSSRWPAIARANGIKNVRALAVGRKLKIP